MTHPTIEVTEQTALAFASSSDLWAWLENNHESAAVLWVKLYKKNSGIASVTWQDCVDAGLCWGWIDGLKKSLDDTAYLQRMTPRKAKSVWSKRNIENVARLTKAGLMQPPGLAQVEAAKADGRWDSAYAGPKDMVIPDDFLAALAQSNTAQDKFATLSRSVLHAIYYQLHSAKRPETRAARMAKMIDRLSQGLPPL